MASITWKDASSWSQSTTAEKRKTPNTWEVLLGSLRVTVHHCIGFGNAWFLSCYEVRLSQIDLDTDDVEVAKRRALSRVLDKAEALFQDAKAIYDELGA